MGGSGNYSKNARLDIFRKVSPCCATALGALYRGNIFMSWFGQEASRQASKAAVEACRSQKDGVSAYRLGGKIIFGCGVCWILLSLIPVACKTPWNECWWMIILGIIQIVAGILLEVLCKKSARFQKWADKDFTKSLKKEQQLQEKVKIGKHVWPMTYGDVLALKVSGVLAVILIVILVIAKL